MRQTLTQRQTSKRARLTTERTTFENDPGGNSQGAEDCADELYADDGRDTDGGEHGGDWGSHESGDNVSDVDWE